MLGANYAEIASALVNIRGAAGEYINAVNGLYLIIEKLSTIWKGNDNLNFVDVINSFKDDMIKLGETINDFAAFLQSSSEIIENTQNKVATEAMKL